MGSQNFEQQAGVDAPKVESRFFAPPAEFEGCFTTFYRMVLTLPEDAVISDYMQPEWTSIRFFSGAWPTAKLGDDAVSGARYAVAGASSHPAHFTIGSTRLWGIGILPLGWARIFDADASDMANRVVNGESHPLFSRFSPLADILCDDTITEEKQFFAIAEAMRGAMRPHRDEARILQVHRALLDQDLKTVSDLAEKADINPRSLARLCCRHFGFAPKTLMRRQRFVRSLSTFMLDSGGKWSGAMDGHYHDQAQFSREFSNFMGMTPSEYAAMDHPVMNSFVAARARMLGSPAQALDNPGG